MCIVCLVYMHTYSGISESERRGEEGGGDSDGRRYEQVEGALIGV